MLSVRIQPAFSQRALRARILQPLGLSQRLSPAPECWAEHFHGAARKCLTDASDFKSTAEPPGIKPDDL